MPKASSEPSTTDRELRAAMVGYQAGNCEAFEQVYETLAPILRRYLLSLTREPGRADDLVQESFLQVHRARHTYDPAHPVIPWVLAISRHVFLMDRRYRQRRHEYSQQGLDDLVLDPGSAHDEAIIARSSLTRALRVLNATTRAAVLLHHVCGLSFDDIAKRLNLGSPALRCRTSRGIARMREVLK